VTFNEAVRHAVSAIIDADLNLSDTRSAVSSLIPKEFHVNHHQP
jgi:hypothetical protein